MNIDEMARTSARLAAVTVTSATDVSIGYEDLLAIRRRRSRVTAIVATAVACAIVALLWAGTAAQSDHHPPPAKPQAPKAFLAAPPLCGDTTVADSVIAQFVNLRSPCPTKPATASRVYLSMATGANQSEPFAFDLPTGWQVSGIPSQLLDGPVLPANGGLLLHSARTGEDFAITVAPFETSASGKRYPTGDQEPQQIAKWAASQPNLKASPVTRAWLRTTPVWQVDLELLPGARHDDRCLVGDGCASVFAVATDQTAAATSLGVFPGGQSRALLFKTPHDHLTVLVWVFGRSAEGPMSSRNSGGVAAIINSLDLDPLSGHRD